MELCTAMRIISIVIELYEYNSLNYIFIIRLVTSEMVKDTFDM
jgi:hypothetical protein